MPDILINKSLYYNPVDFVLKMIGGTWKAPILWRLKGKTLRYSELEKDIPHISQKMLTRALRDLETYGLISKQVFAAVPPHTEYSLTPKGRKVVKTVAEIRDLGIDLMKEEGIDYEVILKESK
jgi:DNA-binding HxlR family transcriptional regulator